MKEKKQKKKYCEMRNQTERTEKSFVHFRLEANDCARRTQKREVWLEIIANNIKDGDRQAHAHAHTM